MQLFLVPMEDAEEVMDVTRATLLLQNEIDEDGVSKYML